MSELGLSALQLNVNFNKYQVFLYQITYQKFNDTISEKLARKIAYEIQKSNDYQILTNLGKNHIISLKEISQLAINLPDLQSLLIGTEKLDLDCNNEQHRQSLQRLINLDINKAAWKIKQSTPNINVEKSTTGYTQIFEIHPSDRIKAKVDYLDVFLSVRFIPDVLPNGTVLIGLHLKHILVTKSGISLQWIIDKKPEWLSKIKKIRHKYFESGKAPLVADFLKVDYDFNGNSFLSHMNKSLVDYHRQKKLVSEQQLLEAENSVLIKVKYGKNEADHIASLVEPMFDFDTLSNIDSRFLNNLAKDLKWSLDDRIKTSSQMVKGFYLPNFDCSFAEVDYRDVHRTNISYKQVLQFSNGVSDSEKDVLKYKAFRDMTRTKIIPLIVGTENDDRSQKLLNDAYNALKRVSNNIPELSKFPSPVKNADELDIRLNKQCPTNAVLLIGLTERANKAAIRDVAFSYGLATQFMILNHKSDIYSPSYFNNVATGLFSKGGGQLCAITNISGDTDLFIGLDMGGVNVRAPACAFLFSKSGMQLGWQLADKQQGERMDDEALMSLLEKSLRTYLLSNEVAPNKITIHRDGKFYESIEVIKQFEQKHNVKVDVLEVIKSGVPVLYRRTQENGKKLFKNPEVGDAVYLSEKEVILSTYSGTELGKSWGDKVSVRPLRLRKRYGETPLEILAQQVLILSRIHGASLYRHPRLPVTTHHADRFATLRQETSIDALSKMDRLCPVYL